jgi:hypothetical protein
VTEKELHELKIGDFIADMNDLHNLRKKWHARIVIQWQGNTFPQFSNKYIHMIGTNFHNGSIIGAYNFDNLFSGIIEIEEKF